MNEKRILHQSTCSDTHEHNGIAELKNKHLLEVEWYMNIPKYLWGDAYKVFEVYHYKGLKNVFPKSRINSKLPLKIFGCTVYVTIPKRLRSKLDPRVENCVFVGYTPN